MIEFTINIEDKVLKMKGIESVKKNAADAKVVVEE